MSTNVLDRLGLSDRGSLTLALQTAIESVKGFFNDNGPEWAAAIAYYSLLSIFPLLLAIASIAAYFVDPNQAVSQATRLLGRFLPMGSGEIQSVVNQAIEARGRVSVFSILVLIWTGTRVFGAMTRALNIAYDVSEVYGFFRRALVQIIMFLSIGLMLILALASQFVLDLAWSALSLPANGDLLIGALRSSIPGLLLAVALFLVYLFVPRRRVDWRAALAGSLLAAGLMLGARPVFLRYVDSFARYNLIYGSLAIVIILVVWAWVLAMILLLGGEVVSHIQALWIEKQPVGEVEHQPRQRARGQQKREEPESAG